MNPIQRFSIDRLQVEVHPSYEAMSEAACKAFEQTLSQVLQQKGEARIIFAVAPSQYGFLERAAQLEGIDWSKVTCFHMDEYVGLRLGDTGSLSGKLHQLLTSRVHPKALEAINGQAKLAGAECWRYEQLLREQPIDICVLGIGENGHVAFNEPHIADFEDPVWVKTVRLDAQSRIQQAREKTFGAEAAVPTHAITLTVPALTAAQTMICIVPGSHKAQAVARTLQGPIDPQCPATALRLHPQTSLFVDLESAALLNLKG